MNITNEELENIKVMLRKRDAQFLLGLKNRIQASRNEFLAMDVKKIRELNKVDKIFFIKEWYNELALFPSNEVLKKFKELGLNSYFLRWFIDIHKILKEFRKIEKQGDLVIFREGAIKNIALYVRSKINHEIQSHFGLIKRHRNDLESTILTKTFHDIFRQKKTKHKVGFRPKDLFTILMHTTADQIIESYESLKEAEKVTKKLAKGKGESIFLKNLHDCVMEFPKKLSLRKKYSLIFNLLKNICKDHKLLSKKEFENLDYQTDYLTYQYSRVRHILDSK